MSYQFTSKNKSITNASCSEFLRIHFTIECLGNNMLILKPINRVFLDLNQQEWLTITDTCLNETAQKSCSVALPALKTVVLYKCSLGSIEPARFKNSFHPETLRLTNNSIRVLDANIFYLNVCKLSMNKIDMETFHGLTKLTELYLNDNSLSPISEGMLCNLVNLTYLHI